MRWDKAGWAVAILLLSAWARAEDDPNALQVHGFVSQGFIKTTRNNYLGNTERAQGSVDFTEVGLNVTKPLSDKLRVGLQLFAHDLGNLGNYAPQFDWYYIDYRFFDWLGLRAGKTKLPWGLYNEANDVDAGRVPVLLPQSIYPASNRELLFAQTGAELYGDVSLGAAGSLEYRLYGGTIFFNTADASIALRDFTVPYLGGGRLMWAPPIEGLQLGSSFQALRLDFDFSPTPEQTMQYQMAGQLPANFGGVVTARLPAKLWVASAEYQQRGLALAAEYSRTYVKYETNLVLPETDIVNQAGYVMGSYQVAPWFTPGAYYSVLLPDIHGSTKGRAHYQHDVAATLRYDITANWLVKVEGHFMHGTAALDPVLNANKPRSQLEKNWGVLLVKTTAYF